MIKALLLAAGASSRMGRPKAGLPLGDRGTVLSVGVEALLNSGFADVTVVAGAHPESVRLASQPHAARTRLVEHKEWEQGQLSSLLAGLDAISVPDLEAVAVLLVDVPLVRPETIRAVVAAWQATRAPIVRPVDGDRHGHPVVFDAAVFDDLRRADLSVGAKAVFATHQARVLNVAVNDRWAFEDLDTPEDYERILNALKQSHE
ncbi:MAG: nucleotidyltransferase family protein [Vicinamibacterales bacterium]